MTSDPIRQACILVGGKGTRLGDLTRTVPKPLISISESAVFLDFVIDQVARQGFNDIVLMAGYLGELVCTRYEGRSLGAARIRVIVEPEPLGTAGALLAAEDVIASRFVMLNGDSFFDINLRALAAKTTTIDDTLIALHHVADVSRYGAVMLNGDHVIHFCEKNHAVGPALISAGVYVMRNCRSDSCTAVLNGNRHFTCPRAGATAARRGV